MRTIIPARTMVALAMAITLTAMSRPLTGQSLPQSSAARAFGGAFAGAAAGALIGGVTGAYIGGNRCVDEGNPDSCYLIAGTAIGLAVGITAGAPLGAHLFNRRLGNVKLGLLASVAIGIAGTVALFHVDDTVRGGGRTAALNSILFGVPVIQALTAGFIEHRTARP